MQKFDDDDELLNDIMNIVQNDEHQQINQFNQLQHSTAAAVSCEATSQLNENENIEFDEEEFDDDEFADEIDEMLEKPIDILDEKEQVNFYTYDKIQIKNIYWRGVQDTILPEGWVQVTHSCGIPLYLNRQSRVCTLSRPYYISDQSARKHDIPISSIPCMAYRKRKEAVEKQIKEHNQAKQMNINLSKCPFESNASETSKQEPANAKDALCEQSSTDPLIKSNKKVVVSIQTNEEKSKESLLTSEQVHEYCKRLFEFDVIKVKKFKTWGDRKKFIKKSKHKKFPENAKMLKIQTKTPKGINKELNINMTNKTPLCIFYEYTSQVYKTTPVFTIQEKETPKDPFHAVCSIDGKVVSNGTGNSKKAAKNNAAETALCILIPEYKSQAQPNDSSKTNDEMYSFFDSYSVDHSHIYVLSQKLAAPLPYDILLTCLKYNFAINMTRNQKDFIEEDIKAIKYRNCLYKMKLAQYEVEVNCTKKKEGRHLASQKILKMMHPHIQTWGSVLRLYGSKMAESYLKNERNEDSETSKSNEKSSVALATTSNNSDNLNHKAKPNQELLEKLKEEMRKIRKPAAATSVAVETKSVDTLLTIPPLLLGDAEFKLSSCSYLMKPDSENKATKLNDDQPSDKIMFNESTRRVEPSTSKRKKIDTESSDESDESSSDSNNLDLTSDSNSD